MEDRDAPATRGDLIDLESRLKSDLESRLKGDLTDLESRLTNSFNARFAKVEEV